MKRENEFEIVLDTPMNILKTDYEYTLRIKSGVAEWREDLEYLHRQLQRDQKGCLSGLDSMQYRRDKRKLNEKCKTNNIPPSSASDSEKVSNGFSESGESEDKFLARPPAKKKKIDVISPISSCCDRLGLSSRKRAMIAASIAKQMDLNVKDTNISVTTAWRKGREKKEDKSRTVRELFSPSPACTLRWDGKRLKAKGGVTTERCVVYMSSADGSKLLGVPAVKNGSSIEEAAAIKSLLQEWKINKEIKGLVFDTISANSCRKGGACLLIEDLSCGLPVDTTFMNYVRMSRSGQVTEVKLCSNFTDLMLQR